MQKEATYKELDYAPFGMRMPSRLFTGASGYKFGYQGSEKDFDVNQGAYTTHFRMLDTRLGRWFSTDPVFQPWQSSYTSMDNNPIWFNDPKGDKIKVLKKGETLNNSKAVKRKLNRYDKLSDKLSSKTGLKGEELNTAMAEKYGKKSNFWIGTDGVQGDGVQTTMTFIGDYSNFISNETSTQTLTQKVDLNVGITEPLSPQDLSQNVVTFTLPTPPKSAIEKSNKFTITTSNSSNEIHKEAYILYEPNRNHTYPVVGVNPTAKIDNPDKFTFTPKTNFLSVQTKGNLKISGENFKITMSYKVLKRKGLTQYGVSRSSRKKMLNQAINQKF